MQILEKSRAQDLEEANQQIQTEKAKNKSLVDSLQRQLDETTDQLSSLQLEHQKLVTKQFEEIANQTQQHETDTAQLQKDLQTVKTDLIQANQKISEMKLEKAQLENSLNQVIIFLFL